MQIEMMKTSELVPYAKNAKLHSDSQVAAIAGSIREFSFNNPVLIDKDNGIIAGHGRVLAAQLLKMGEVPCIRLSHLTDTQRRAYILAYNRLQETGGGWNEDMLKIELGELQTLDFDLSLTGFDGEFVSSLNGGTEGLTDPDDVPEPPKVPITKLGDIWQLGNHRLMCGDSTDANSVALLMDGKKADMIFTDPPYGMFLDADYTSMESKFKGSTGGNKYENVIGDHSDFNPSLIKTIFDNFPYCKEVFLWGADYYSEHLPSKNKGSWIVWDKRGDESADKMFGSAFELCWSKTRYKRMLARVKWAGIFGTEKEHDKKRSHPTQKPVALVEWFFEYYSIQGKLNIVDLYGGAGSTLLGSEKLDKKCFTMELDPKYCDVIIKRWEDFTGKKAELVSK